MRHLSISGSEEISHTANRFPVIWWRLLTNAEMISLTDHNPLIARALWWSTLVDEANTPEWCRIWDSATPLSASDT